MKHLYRFKTGVIQRDHYVVLDEKLSVAEASPLIGAIVIRNYGPNGITEFTALEYLGEVIV